MSQIIKDATTTTIANLATFNCGGPDSMAVDGYINNSKGSCLQNWEKKVSIFGECFVPNGKGIITPGKGCLVSSCFKGFSPNPTNRVCLKLDSPCYRPDLEPGSYKAFLADVNLDGNFEGNLVTGYSTGANPGGIARFSACMVLSCNQGFTFYDLLVPVKSGYSSNGTRIDFNTRRGSSNIKNDEPVYNSYQAIHRQSDNVKPPQYTDLCLDANSYNKGFAVDKQKNFPTYVPGQWCAFSGYETFAAQKRLSFSYNGSICSLMYSTGSNYSLPSYLMILICPEPLGWWGDISGIANSSKNPLLKAEGVFAYDVNSISKDNPTGLVCKFVGCIGENYVNAGSSIKPTCVPRGTSLKDTCDNQGIVDKNDFSIKYSPNFFSVSNNFLNIDRNTCMMAPVNMWYGFDEAILNNFGASSRSNLRRPNRDFLIDRPASMASASPASFQRYLPRWAGTGVVDYFDIYTQKVYFVENGILKNNEMGTPTKLAPKVVWQYPENGDIKAEIQSIIIYFNKDVNIDPYKIYLKKIVGFSEIETKIRVKVDEITVSKKTKGSRLEIKPIDFFKPFDINSKYALIIDSKAIYDELGQYFSGYTKNTDYTFSFIDDRTFNGSIPPILTLVSKTPVGISEDVNAAINLTFDKAFKLGVGKIVLYRYSDDKWLRGFDTSDSDQVSQSNYYKTLTIKPKDPLPANTKIYIKIPYGTVFLSWYRYVPPEHFPKGLFLKKDDFTFTTAASTSTVTSAITTGSPPDISLFPKPVESSTYSVSKNKARPFIESLSPEDNSLDVLVGTDIKIKFSEHMHKGKGNIFLYKLGSSTPMSIDINGPNAELLGNLLTIKLPQSLALNSMYFVKLPKGLVKAEYDSVDFIGIDNTTDFNFKTIEQMPDRSPPTLNANTPLKPKKNSIDVLTDTKFVINFSENIKFGKTGFISVYKKSDNKKMATIDVSTPTNGLNIAANMLTVNFNYTLSKNTEYLFTIDKWAILDMDGNPFSGISKGEYKFKTTDGPQIIDSYPKFNSSDVLTNTTLKVVFDEPIAIGVNAKNFGLYRFDIATNKFVWAKAYNVADKSVVGITSGTTLILNLAQNFLVNTKYLLLIPSSTIKDASGNYFQGTGSNDFIFTTALDGVAPKLISKSPEQNTTGISRNTNIELIFDEQIVLNPTGKINLYKDGATKPATTINMNDVLTVSLDSSLKKLIINPPIVLEPGKKYHVLIGWGAIRDLTGNQYGGIGKPGVYFFTTGNN